MRETAFKLAAVTSNFVRETPGWASASLSTAHSNHSPFEEGASARSPQRTSKRARTGAPPSQWDGHERPPGGGLELFGSTELGGLYNTRILDPSGNPSLEYDPDYLCALLKEEDRDVETGVQNSFSGLDWGAPPGKTCPPPEPVVKLRRADTEDSDNTLASGSCNRHSGASSPGLATPFADPQFSSPFEPSHKGRKRKSPSEQQSSASVITVTWHCGSGTAPMSMLELDGHSSAEPDLELYITVENVEAQLKAIPHSCRVNFNTRLGLSPVLLRGREGLMAANVGLRVNRIEHEPSLQLGLYGLLQPSVITTGTPPMPPACKRKISTESVSHSLTRSSTVTRSGMSLRNSSLSHHPATVPVYQTQREDFRVEEAILLKRSLASGSVESKWHCAGELQIVDGKLLSLPVWEGDDWVVDVIARIADTSCSNMWVKSTAVRLRDTF